MTEYDDYGVPVGAYQEPDSFTGQTYRTARAFLVYRVRPWVEGMVAQGRWKRVFSLVNALVVMWWMAVYWGERGAFDSAVGSCDWSAWEQWEQDANPHRLVFVADPQLVDPHTYPGRPWPLNPLTIKYTDQYMRRAYSRIQTALYPDTVFFLGDLFDGGREWSTRTTHSPEKQYQRYGDSYWMNEYRRFGRIFFDHWGDGGLHPRAGQPGRKFISSLPGNHDLGFAKGVQMGVRDRFHAYFGDGNRIDVLGNHTFISIDSVSLSALGDASSTELEALWKPTVDFLATAKTQKRKYIQRALRTQQGLNPYPLFSHREIPSKDLATSPLPQSDTQITEFPSILLTHVPLYRAPGTPCGPLRERHPPTPPPPGQTHPVDPDERNAISVSGGYQYQNVMNKDISADIASRIGDIAYAFSGDDHDYCALTHRGYASAGAGIREVTVKSISWAMGVRKPGFVMASLWNPVDAVGTPLNHGQATLQSHLCLLPDQLGIFARYALLFALTLVLLTVRAALLALRSPGHESSNGPLLPTTRTRDPEPWHSHSSNTSTSPATNPALRTRSAAPGYALPAPAPMPHQQDTYSLSLDQHAGFYPSGDVDEKKDRKDGRAAMWGTKTRKETKGGVFWAEMRGSLGRVLVCGLGYYAWLVWWG